MGAMAANLGIQSASLPMLTLRRPRSIGALSQRDPSSFSSSFSSSSSSSSALKCALTVSNLHLAAASLKRNKKKKKKKMMIRCQCHVGGSEVRTLLIDNYDSYTYNIYQLLSIVNQVPPVVIRNDEWTTDQIRHLLYEEKAFDNIVISPGPGSPACPADIGICLQILSQCHDIPILGVCLGHQALGLVHGAQIVHAPEPIHGRLSEIEHNGCNIFCDIPSGRNSGFKVVRYHSLVISADSLPKELIPIAWTSSIGAGLSDLNQINNFERREVLMGVMHCTRPHYGVQFHPESVATHYGRQIFENFKKITVGHWLRSSLHQERKVSYACQSSKELLKNKLLHNKADISCQLDICKNPVLAANCLDAKYLKLEWKKIDCLANLVGGSEKVFCSLFGDKNAENTFWLDSSCTDMGRARFSFMGGKGGPLWKQLTYQLSHQRAGGYLSVKDGSGSKRTKFLQDGLFDFLNKELQSFHYDKEDYEGLPFDFCGGFVGFIGYNLKVECGAASNSYRSTTPDACLFLLITLL